jgi:SAM-dependent methyltransferase
VDDFRAASLESWSSVAPDWGELIPVVDRQLRRAAEWMIEAAAPGPGERVLELAGGPGTVGLTAARAVGQQGHVICTDFSEAMVGAARRRAADQQQAENVEFRMMDAEAIDLPDGSVDIVLCRMGYMLMADPATALKESARVLKPGGRLALAVWSKAADNPWAGVPMRAIMGHLGAPPPPPGAPGLWALADDDHLHHLLTSAGLESVRIELLDDHVEYESFEAWMELTRRLAGPIRALLENLDDDAQAAIRARASTEAEQYRNADGSFSVPERMIGAAARRPG